MISVGFGRTASISGDAESPQKLMAPSVTDWTEVATRLRPLREDTRIYITTASRTAGGGVGTAERTECFHRLSRACCISQLIECDSNFVRDTSRTQHREGRTSPQTQTQTQATFSSEKKEKRNPFEKKGRESVLVSRRQHVTINSTPAGTRA